MHTLPHTNSRQAPSQHPDRPSPRWPSSEASPEAAVESASCQRCWSRWGEGGGKEAPGCAPSRSRSRSRSIPSPLGHLDVHDDELRRLCAGPVPPDSAAALSARTASPSSSAAHCQAHRGCASNRCGTRKDRSRCRSLPYFKPLRFDQLDQTFIHDFINPRCLHTFVSSGE